MKLSSIKYSVSKLVLSISFIIVTVNLPAQIPETPGLQNLQPNQISLRNWVDRTALFPGDSLSYQIEIRVDANMGILLDDLDGNELSLTGLALDSSTIGEAATDLGTTYTASYQLSSFETGGTSLQIDAMTVRYYFRRPGQRLENVAVAGEVIVPAVSIAMQSTLPADPASLRLRDMGSPDILRGIMRSAGTLGFILFLVSIVPLIVMLRKRLEKSESQQDAYDRDEIIEETSAELLQLKQIDPEVPELRLDGFNQLEQIIKGYIEKSLGIKATSFTSGELTKRVADMEAALPVSELEEILQSCEAARYGKIDNLPSGKSFNKGLVLVQGLLNN